MQTLNPAPAWWAPQHASLAAGWSAVVQPFWATSTGQQLLQFLQQRRQSARAVYPSEPLTALALTPLAQVRAVILGQDPYHGAGQAEGLAFSVAHGVRHPPSLRNIFKERQRDLGLPVPVSGSLRHWARQGVLLLNTSLTVEDGQPASHAGQGWQALTDAILRAVAERAQPTAYLLWGAHAQATAQRVLGDAPSTCACVLRCNHPSPLSATRGPEPFVGSAHFSRSRDWLAAQGDSGAHTLFGNPAD